MKNGIKFILSTMLSVFICGEVTAQIDFLNDRHPEPPRESNTIEQQLKNNRVKGDGLYDIDNIPDIILNHTDLIELRFGSSRKLKNIPDKICNLKKLEIFEMVGTSVSELPVCFFKLQNLKELYISSSPFREIPEDIGKLTQLKKLHLTNIPLSKLPKTIRKLTNIEEFTLQGIATRYKDDQGNELINEGFKKFPTEILTLKQLKGLHIVRCGITDIPNEITEMSNLKWIDIRNNKLTALNPVIFKLPNLETLDLRGNPIDSLPEEIIKAPKLRRILIGGTNISKESIEELRKKMPDLEINTLKI